MRTIVWFRGKDLRLSDHAPLRHALDGGEVIPLFVVDPYFFEPNRAKHLPHRIQFLLDGLHELAQAIRRKGSQLLLVQGKSTQAIPNLVKRFKADRVVAHRWVEPFARQRDRRIKEALGDRFVLFEGETLHPPGTLRTGSGTPYAVFTPFSRAFATKAEIGAPLPTPRALPPLPAGLDLPTVELPTMESLGLKRNGRILPGGEEAARRRLKRFVEQAAADYAEQRDRMDLEGTSRLSADLKFGTLSVRTAWLAVEETAGNTKGGKAFLNELVWREFAYSTLWDRPELLQKPFRSRFENFPWENDDRLYQAWEQGMTGYPIIDASARQLLAEGFVHNRARMISASFLTKHLLNSYQRGEAHYMKFLTDGDWASNNAGWQWSAGCGCDAQPYFRVFNPISQGKKFDPNGAYVRRWVPELKELPTTAIHAPWEATEIERRAAGVLLGQNYPHPIVDHKEARTRFLAAAKT